VPAEGTQAEAGAAGGVDHSARRADDHDATGRDHDHDGDDVDDGGVVAAVDGAAFEWFAVGVAGG
jgi:hypothetical protein